MASHLFLSDRCVWLAGWAAAMALLVRWWGQLQAKASSPETGPLLEDECTAVHSSQHSFVSRQQHHSRHHDAQVEAGLIEQQGSGGYGGYQGSDTSSCNRGVLPGLSKRRRLPTATLLSLHGQCRYMFLRAPLPFHGSWVQYTITPPQLCARSVCVTVWTANSVMVHFLHLTVMAFVYSQHHYLLSIHKHHDS